MFNTNGLSNWSIICTTLTFVIGTNLVILKNQREKTKTIRNVI